MKGGEVGGLTHTLSAARVKDAMARIGDAATARGLGLTAATAVRSRDEDRRAIVGEHSRSEGLRGRRDAHFVRMTLRCRGVARQCTSQSLSLVNMTLSIMNLILGKSGWIHFHVDFY